MKNSEKSWLQNVYALRYALKHMLLKDFRVRYRNMSLGVIWSILNPLIMLSILHILFTYIYPQRGIDHFPIFLLAGLVCYNMLNLTVPAATSCIMDNASIVKKVSFPKFLLPISIALSQTLHILIQLLLVFTFALVQKLPCTIYWLWVPFIILVELVFVLGLSMVTSALNVYFRDVRYMVDNSLAVLFWLSPVFYPLSAVTEYSRWWVSLSYQFNPLAGCIDAMRQSILYANHPDPIAFGLATVISLFIFSFGLFLFRRMEPVFPDLI